MDASEDPETLIPSCVSCPRRAIGGESAFIRYQRSRYYRPVWTSKGGVVLCGLGTVRTAADASMVLVRLRLLRGVEWRRVCTDGLVSRLELSRPTRANGLPLS